MIQIHSTVFKRILRLFRRREVRYPTILVFLLLGMMVLFAAVFAAFEEGANFLDGLWTAYISLTTIGYGDFSAHSPEGRLITVVTTMFGITCFGIFTGIIVEKALQRRIKKLKGEGNYTGEGHLVIINVPSYEETRGLLDELNLSPEFMDIPIVIVTASLPHGDREVPDQLSKRIDGFVMGLPSALETLERANLSRARACLLMAASTDPKMDDTNTLTAGLIEKNWPQVLTILACSRAETMKNLKMFNIDGGINAMKLQTGLLVQELEDPGVFEVYNQLSSNAGGSQIYISRTQVGRWKGAFDNFTYGDIKKAALRLNFPTELLGIKKDPGGNIVLNPSNSLKLEKSDRLIYMAEERFDWLKHSSEILERNV